MKNTCTYVLLVLWTALACPHRVLAQDIHLSQFYETPLLRNPSLAGIFTGDYRVQAVYRTQWNTVTIPYQTGALSGEVRFPVGKQHDFLTLALQATFDEAGSSHLQSSQFLPCINFHKSLSSRNNTYLSIGFMGGIADRQFDPSKLTFDNQYNSYIGYDPTASSNEDLSHYSYTYLDGAFGLSFSSTAGEGINYFFGGSYYHFNKPKVSFFNNPAIELSPKWEINAGITLPIGDRVKVVAQYNQLRQGKYSEIMVGGLLGYGLLKQGIESNTSVYGGLFLRWNDALVPVIKLDMEKYAISFSYDVNVSTLTRASMGVGGFEVCLSWKGFFTSQNSSLNKMNCPRF